MRNCKKSNMNTRSGDLISEIRFVSVICVPKKEHGKHR
jgi:hypothetical protein